jgi:hypothetical protein
MALVGMTFLAPTEMTGRSTSPRRTASFSAVMPTPQRAAACFHETVGRAQSSESSSGVQMVLDRMVHLSLAFGLRCVALLTDVGSYDRGPYV